MFRKSLKVSKKQIGSYDTTGKWVDGAVTRVVTIQASVQPITGNDIKTLPENRRSIESYVLYTTSNLTILNELTGQRGDTVTINGDNYEVVTKFDWQNNIINHYKYVVQRIL